MYVRDFPTAFILKSRAESVLNYTQFGLMNEELSISWNFLLNEIWFDVMYRVIYKRLLLSSKALTSC